MGRPVSYLETEEARQAAPQDGFERFWNYGKSQVDMRR